MEKRYLIAKDPGFTRKIAFIDKQSMGERLTTDLIKIVESTGDSENQKGFEASAPTLYFFIDGISQVEAIKSFSHLGSYYLKQDSLNESVVVFCHSFNEGMFDSSTPALNKVIQFFN